MPVATLRPEVGVIRKRKAHKKSRQGCNNCKIRRVKCDEAKPCCSKCVDYGVSCNYGSQSEEDLQLSVAGSFVIDVPQVAPPKGLSLNRTILSMINAPLTQQNAATPFPAYEMSQQDLDTLKRFQERTVSTIGTRDSYKVYRDVVVELACRAPYLMHLILTLTLLHDRYLTGTHKQSVREAFHWYQGTALFNDLLTRPIKHEDKDALWASASMLGAIAFSDVDDTSPQTVWPLAPSSQLDLEWLKMSDGKREIARLADLTRADSAFRSVQSRGYTMMLYNPPKPSGTFEHLPTSLVDFCNLTDSSGPHNNSYYLSAVLLDRLMPGECNHVTILSYFSFTGHMPEEYKTLLRQRDPRALVLMAHWYAKMCEYKQWWIYKRALIECQAICLYLQQYHGHEIQLGPVLEFPMSRCGLDGSLWASLTSAT